MFTTQARIQEFTHVQGVGGKREIYLFSKRRKFLFAPMVKISESILDLRPNLKNLSRGLNPPKPG